MIIPICIVGLLLIILERIIPNTSLPSVKGWWKRVIIINILQLSVVIGFSYTLDNLLFNLKSFDFTYFPNFINGFLSYILLTFVFYWWHRFRHDSHMLWDVFHQIHHSPQRIETITSFYKHPIEIIVNSILIGFVNYSLMGMNLESASWCIFYSSMGEYFYHMNIKTPHWVGFIFQRPEMHRIHHKKGYHYKNFSDLPIWDFLFGTLINPKTNVTHCGFKTERELKFKEMLFFKNVN